LRRIREIEAKEKLSKEEGETRRFKPLYHKIGQKVAVLKLLSDLFGCFPFYGNFIKGFLI